MSVNLDSLTSSSALDVALRDDAQRCEDEDIRVMWFHAHLSRSDAEKLLSDGLNQTLGVDLNGMFLVRGTAHSDRDYCLSFVHQLKFYHYYIKCVEDNYFQIPEGPKVHGLDKLIEHYIESSTNLLTRLTNLCKGTLPPARVRRNGPTNLLHTALLEGREDIASNILKHRLCPDIDAKNKDGCTALHLAVGRNLESIVRLLLAKGADVAIKDPEGDTPLFRACLNNSVECVKLIVQHDASTVVERNPITRWVPLHAAAMKGNTQCAEILLAANAPLYPRGLEEEIPLDLANKYGRNKCQVYLENYKVQTVPKWSEEVWLHPGVNREDAKELFNDSAKTKGLFLVRKSSKGGNLVLNVFDGKAMFNYSLDSKEFRRQMVFFIDDGPLLPSLSLLIQHYHTFSDGLITRLTEPVRKKPQAEPDPLPDEPGQVYEYSSCTSSQPPASPPPLPTHPKPRLPPRLPNLDIRRTSPNLSQPASLTGKVDTDGPSSPTNNTSVSPGLSSPRVGELPGLVKIARKDLKLGEELGKGEYGSVLRGTLIVKRKRFGKTDKVDVAIKIFHSVEDPEDFLKEAKVMQNLRNDYIVELKGICDDKCLMLVEEFLPMGSMLDFLDKHPSEVEPKRELCLWAAQIARGMKYLESQRLVHRDLAARNILLASLQKVKISDFGLSRAMGTDKEYYKASKGGRWPIKWYAPESVNYGHFSRASDVWSYGITLWEMFSYGSAPYDNMSAVEVIKFIEDGDRLAKPQRCPDVVYTTMLSCWKLEPTQRPTFSWLDSHFSTEDEYSSNRELMSARQ